MLRQLLFSIFINDLYLWITKTDLLNFVDGNTITTAERTVENFISPLEAESQVAIEWYLEKFQTIVIKRDAKMKGSYPLNINNLTINSESRVKLPGIEIGNKLSFEQRISTLCNKASSQLNAIGRIQQLMGFKEKTFFLMLLYTQTLIIVFQFGIFAHLNLFIKLKKTRAGSYIATQRLR